IVIDDETGVESGVLVRIVESNAEEVLVDRRIDGAIEQRAGELDVHLLGDYGMWIAREGAVVWESNHHRDAPRVGAEQPVERGLLVFAELVVARHAPIQVGLRRKRGHQVIGAPDEGNADSESVIGSLNDSL